MSDRYSETEAEFLAIWNGWDEAKRESLQMNRMKIPSWVNAPEWAKWIQFCAHRGWLFSDIESPHVYGDGRMDSASRFERACDVPGVIFFDNVGRGGMPKYVAAAAPFWVCERRHAIAKARGETC